MAVEIKMPQLSDTMSGGKILAWRKNEGDAVARGDILAEVETDKANLEIESFNAGTLLKILVPAGTNATVGDVIALIGQAGESVAPSTPASAGAAGQPAAQTPRPAATPNAVAASTASSASASPAAGVPSASASHGERIKISPLARKIAEQKNIELSALRGSGPHGRIVKRDVEQLPPGSSGAQVLPMTARSERSTAATSASQPSSASSGGGRTTPLSKMRETIARRMQESVTTAPHFYVTTSVRMGEASRLREILKERAEYKGISVNHLVIKAAAYALEREPRVNNAMRDGQLYEPDQINIGIITAVEDGLLIPVIKEANLLSLRDIAFEARSAVERARAGRPSAHDLTGGTFSISNMGMFDVENFSAIINPGQGAVLAVSSIHEEPLVVKGHVIAGLMMKATISVDHRIIDGVMAANFMKFFKEGLETPALLMV